MTPAQVSTIVGYCLGLGIAINVVVSVAKMPIRLAIRRRGKLTIRQRALLAWLLRLLAVVLGVGIARVPGMWPAGVSEPWAVLLGLSSGGLSLVAYHAAEAAIPALLQRVAGGGLTAGMKQDGGTGEFVPVEDGEVVIERRGHRAVEEATQALRTRKESGE